MRSVMRAAAWGGLGLLCLLLAQEPARPQGKLRTQPKLEPIAQTRVLMVGINAPYFQGLDQILREKPANDDAWGAVSAQALLIAENGNLLLLRPPKGADEPTTDKWNQRAVDLRTAATQLAQDAEDEDYQRCRTALINLAKTCNRCHEAFKVQTRIAAFAERAVNDAGLPAVPAPPKPPSPPKPPAPPAPPAPPKPPPVPGERP
jgi:hypothetical protein